MALFGAIILSHMAPYHSVDFQGVDLAKAPKGSGELARWASELTWKDHKGTAMGNKGRTDKVNMFTFWFFYIAMYLDAESPFMKKYNGKPGDKFVQKMSEYCPSHLARVCITQWLIIIT